LPCACFRFLRFLHWSLEGVSAIPWPWQLCITTSSGAVRRRVQLRTDTDSPPISPLRRSPVVTWIFRSLPFIWNHPRAFFGKVWNWHGEILKKSPGPWWMLFRIRTPWSSASRNCTRWSASCPNSATSRRLPTRRFSRTSRWLGTRSRSNSQPAVSANPEFVGNGFAEIRIGDWYLGIGKGDGSNWSEGSNSSDGAVGIGSDFAPWREDLSAMPRKRFS